MPLLPSPKYLSGLAAIASSLGLGACHAQPPKGQVVAVVNDHEITLQDLGAEARAGQAAPPQALLQRILARELLAQDAHLRHLDGYPGFPADMGRLKSTFLADRELRSVVKSPAPPAEAAISQFIAGHPFMFQQRMRLTAETVRFQSADDLRSIQGLEDLNQVVSRLKALNVQYDRRTQQLDTATIGSDLATRLASLPLDQMIIIHAPDVIVALRILDRQPLVQGSEQQRAQARALMLQADAQQQVESVLNRLRSHARITYHSGYEPGAHRGGGNAASSSSGADAADKSS